LPQQLVRDKHNAIIRLNQIQNIIFLIFFSERFLISVFVQFLRYRRTEQLGMIFH
jgi:hypothetical protein